MFKENTLLVVGAGASQEFGLPIGHELSEIISRESLFKFEYGDFKKGNYKTYQWLLRRFKNKNELTEKLRALRTISDKIFMASSIDNFIDMHPNQPHIAEMGKLQIAIAIADREKNSNLYFDQNQNKPLDLKALGDTWIDSFARVLFEKIPIDQIDNIGKDISIICFNYDRCIEHYLIQAISQTYIGVDYDQARQVVSNMNIIHPYGTLGELPNSLSGGGGREAIRFGGEVGIDFDPWPIAERLKTYTEQIKDAELVDKIRTAVEKAGQIIFLGFAFHPQNMELMSLVKGTSFKRIYSTGKGISPQENEAVKDRILKLYTDNSIDFRWRENMHIEVNSTCAELFKMHWRNLSVV